MTETARRLILSTKKMACCSVTWQDESLNILLARAGMPLPEPKADMWGLHSYDARSLSDRFEQRGIATVACRSEAEQSLRGTGSVGRSLKTPEA